MKITLNNLSNGLEYLNIYSGNLNSATIMVLVRVGSRYESEKEAGLAHFVEHTFFKGSKGYPSSKSIGMAIERLGGSSNAFTSYEYTGYYIKVPVENVVPALEIMADIIKNPLFPEKEVEKERGVVIEEIKMYEDIPMRKVEQEFMGDLFGKHSLGRDIAGTIDSVSNLGRSDTLEFTSRFYNTENMLLVVSGGIDNDTSLGPVKDYFSAIQEGKKSKYEPFKSQDDNKILNVINKDLEQTHIVLGGMGLKRDLKERYSINLGTAILSGGFGSLLFQKIREDLGLAYYIRAAHRSFDEIGYWSVNMGVDKNRIQESIEAVLSELKKFKEGDFSDDNLERARNYMLGNLVTDLEGSDDIGYWLGTQQLLEGETKEIDEVKDIIREITKDDIIASWDKIFNRGGYKLTMLTKDNPEMDGENVFKGL